MNRAGSRTNLPRTTTAADAATTEKGLYMTTTGPQHVQLDRAYAESKVIEANLTHLSVVLAQSDVVLRDDLRSLTSGFVAYVRKLGDASAVAARDERAAANNGAPATPH